jgi:hypothetical protein
LGIHWQRQELDLEIMKMLYEYGPIRARTFVDVFSNHKQQKVYDRLRELRRMEMLDSEVYVGESDEEQSSNRIKKPKKYGKVYFLTSYGVERTKLLVYGAEKDGNERSQRPDDKEIATYWKASLLMSNIPLKFMPKRIFKRKYDLPNNMMIDLGYKRWAITFARNSTETHRARLAHQMSVMVNRGHSKNLILCNTRAQQLSLVKYFRTAYAPGVYVLVFNDYDTITRLLTDTVMEDTIHGSRSCVIGFGRVGITLARTLKAMGAEVTVVARNPGQLARAYEMGCVRADYSQLRDIVNNTDVIYNTVPQLILDRSVLKYANPELLIIDLATQPGGTDFEAANVLGIKAILAPGLPGKVAPVFAGRILADVIPRLIISELAKLEKSPLIVSREV